MNICIVEDNRMLLDNLRLLLQGEADMEVVAQAVDGHNVLTQLDAACPDVICMDINMAKLNGIETTRQVLRLQPQVKVIGLSAHVDASLVTIMVQAGAVGYVVKSNACAELLPAIRAVVQGQTYFGTS